MQWKFWSFIKIEKKKKFNNILTEKCKKDPDFKHEFFSKTAKGFHKIGYDSILLLKRMVYEDN